MQKSIFKALGLGIWFPRLPFVLWGFPQDTLVCSSSSKTHCRFIANSKLSVVWGWLCVTWDGMVSDPEWPHLLDRVQKTHRTCIGRWMDFFCYLPTVKPANHHLYKLIIYCQCNTFGEKCYLPSSTYIYRWPWLANVTVIDKRKRVYLPSCPESSWNNRLACMQLLLTAERQEHLKLHWGQRRLS